MLNRLQVSAIIQTCLFSIMSASSYCRNSNFLLHQSDCIRKHKMIQACVSLKSQKNIRACESKPLDTM